MSDYTPTTQQVEDGFAHEPEYEYSNPIGYGAHVQSNRRAFRRWLAEVERAAAEKAWAEGYRLKTMTLNDEIIGVLNPYSAEAYRQERKEQ